MDDNIHIHPSSVDMVKADLATSLARLPAAKQEALDAIARATDALNEGDYDLTPKLAMDLMEVLSTMLRVLSSLDSTLLSMSTERMVALDQAPGASRMVAKNDVANKNKSGKS